MRKITFGNRTELGAKNHVVIMDIIQTGVLNGIEPLEVFRALSTKPFTSFNELPDHHKNPKVKLGVINFWF